MSAAGPPHSIGAYVDASAIVKLLTDEPETEQLVDFLTSRLLRISSAILAVELLCTCHRRGLSSQDAHDLLDDIALVPLSDTVLAAASQPFTPPQRALDAIHLATAAGIREEFEFVTYDVAQRQAAEALGLTARTPGMDA